jgi:arylformamidase
MTKAYGDRTQDELDTAYNARASVPDFENTYLPGFGRDSERVRQALPGPRDVAYGPHCDQVCDIFPAKDQGAPVHLFLHGGYWRMLTKDENSYVADVLTPAGATVMVNSYSLCPDVHIDVIVRQCRAFVAWAYRNAHLYGGDPRRLYISGHSAGGHLVGMMLATDWAAEYGLPADVIKGATAMSGLFDLRPLRAAFTNEWLQLSEMAAERNSPLFHLPPADKCPVIVSYGGNDPIGFHEQSQAYMKALKAHGVQVTYVELPGLDHFAVGNQFMDARSPLTRAILAQMGLG